VGGEGEELINELAKKGWGGERAHGGESRQNKVGERFANHAQRFLGTGMIPHRR
jgi:hypothetical protein